MELSTKNGRLLARLSSLDLISGVICPQCSKFYRPNGTGPSNIPFLPKLLKLIPSEFLAGGLPAAYHDIAYLLCPVGWAIEFDYLGKTYTANSKKTADKAYRRMIIDRARKQFSLNIIRAIAWSIAWRNWFFVHTFGGKSYSHEHSAEMEKQGKENKIIANELEFTILKKESPPT